MSRMTQKETLVTCPITHMVSDVAKSLYADDLFNRRIIEKKRCNLNSIAQDQTRHDEALDEVVNKTGLVQNKTKQEFAWGWC